MSNTKPNSYLELPGIQFAFNKWGMPQENLGPGKHEIPTLARLSVTAKNLTPLTTEQYKNEYKHECEKEYFGHESKQIIADLLQLTRSELVSRVAHINFPPRTTPEIYNTIKMHLKLWLVYLGLNIVTIPDETFNLFDIEMRAGPTFIQAKFYKNLFEALKDINNQEIENKKIEQILRMSIILSTMDQTCDISKLGKLKNIYGLGRHTKTHNKKRKNRSKSRKYKRHKKI
jgi:hypothetical protein